MVLAFTSLTKKCKVNKTEETKSSTKIQMTTYDPYTKDTTEPDDFNFYDWRNNEKAFALI